MADVPIPEDQPPSGTDPGPTQRVADADRDRAVAQLREHVVDGRLTLDEFSERVGRALAARTQGDLGAVMTDLPAPTSSSALLPEPAADTTPATTRKKRRWHIAVLSGHSTRGRWRISGKTNAVAFMGGCDMDLRKAEIDGPEVAITAVAFMGGVTITVPEGFDVELQGFSFMGGRDLKLRDVPRVPGSPLIVVRGFAVMGGIEVKSRSSRSKRRLARTAAGLPEVDDVDDVDDEPSGVPTTSRGPALPLPPGASTPPGPTVNGPPARARTPSESPPATPMADLVSAVPDVATDGTVTILFCDMVDYAGMTERLGDHTSRQLLHEEHRLVRDALARHGGREVKVQGDGFMVAFGGAARALRCAIDIQQTTRAYVPPAGMEPIAVHIGIHTGDALAEEGDYLGHTVIVASRLADVAGTGEILVSSLSQQLVQGSGEFTFVEHRETQLKGMARAQPSATLAWTQ
jgi:class 3 adenylate cyclase